MRLRRKPGADQKLVTEYAGLVASEPLALRGRWKEALGGQRLEVEIGAGKGQFIIEKARLFPEVAFLAVEREPDVLLKAARKTGSGLPPNLRLLLFDAAAIDEVFDPGEVGRIYLNFPDPWPKNRHAKRRLTARSFLEKYQRILEPGARIHLKTDNGPLFAFSIEEFSRMKWTLHGVRLDYGLREAEGDVPTEYEERFRAAGQRIFRLEAETP